VSRAADVESLGALYRYSAPTSTQVTILEDLDRRDRGLHNTGLCILPEPKLSTTKATGHRESDRPPPSPLLLAQRLDVCEHFVGMHAGIDVEVDFRDLAVVVEQIASAMNDLK